MDIFSGIASILSGGVTGIIGSVAQGIFAYKSKQLDVELQKQKYSNELELRKADAVIMAQEWASRTSIAQTEATAQIDSEDSKSFHAALTSEPQRYAEGTLTSKQNWMMVILDFIRGIIRPGLTLYLCGITTAIYFHAKSLMGTDMISAQAYELVTQIVNTILYLTTTCVLFWFGTRNKQK
jgi:hypothetical protein